MIRLKLPILILLILLQFFSLLGQKQSLNFQQLDQTKGLSNEFNGHFQIDKTGIFWTSTRDGLNRFDGKNVKVFRPTLDSVSLDPNITSYVFEDKNNNRWFTSITALHCIVSGTDSLKTWQFSEDQNSYYYAFHFERDSFLWVIADKQLFKINVYESISRRKALHPYDGFVAYAIENKDNEVTGLARPLISNGSGIEILNYGNDKKPKIDSFFVSNSKTVLDTFVFYLHIENPNSFWLPSTAGLIHFNPSEPNFIKVNKNPFGKKSNNYQDIAPWKEKYLWISTNNEGLLLFDKNQEKFIRQDSVFMVDNRLQGITKIKSVFVDENENLWYTVFDQGIFYTNLKNNKFEQLIPIETLEKNKVLKVNSILEIDSNAYLCAIDRYGLVKVLEGDSSNVQPTVSQIIVPNSPSSRINFLFKDSDEDVWILAEDKVICWSLNSNQFQTKLLTPIYTSNLIEISKGEFLLIDFNNIYRFSKNDKLQNTSALNPLIPNLYLPAQLFFDHHSQLLFLSQGDNALLIFDKKENFKQIKRLENVGIVNGLATSIKKDTIWLASSTGLFAFNPNTLLAKKIKSTNLDLNKYFVSVVEDKNQDIWLSSFGGIYKYSLKSDSAFHFTQSDGLLTMQYGENSSLLTSTGKVIFGGARGASLFDPDEVQLNTNLPKIELLELLINNIPQNRIPFANENLPPRIKYSDNDLSFQFAALEYSDPINNSFRYHLIKNKRDTVLTAYSDQVQLNELSPGNYRLDCYASNSDQVWTKKPKSYFFIIRPPWYQTWWARILGFLALVSIIYAWYRYRIAQIKKRETFKRKEAEFKQKEAEFKQLAAETETAVLRLQMNPHFIFNSLNSINSYILQKDVDTANEYLNQFAQLMRMILDKSEHTYIDIEEEVELLSLYLQTEAMRLGKKLDYKIEIDPSLDPQETILPTMILQPFVENAIWHGISPKQGQGLVQIRFLNQKGHLVCEVEDNGVGRGYKGDAAQSHQSKSITITQKRLDLLSKDHSSSEMKVIDLVSPQGEAIGTKVQLILPILE